jgi:hypothetical protein
MSPGAATEAAVTARTLSRRLRPVDPLAAGVALAFLGGSLLGLLSARAMGWLG